MKRINFRNSLTIVILIAVFVLSFAVISGAQNFPEKAITIVVPWGPGGVSDSRVRIMAQYVEDILGQPIVIKNIGGASGAVGTEEALKARSDGYTLISVDDATWYAMHSGLGEYVLADFEPIASITKWPLVLAIRADSPWNSIDELIEYSINERPIKFAVTVGNQSHLVPKLIADQTGANFNYITPQGDVARQAALLAGNVDAVMSYVPAAAEYLKAGEFKLLAITSPERHDVLPEIPTLLEQNIDVEYVMRGGLCAPAGTPKEVVAVLESAYQKAIQNEEMVKKLDNLALTIDFKTSEEMSDYLVEINEVIAEFSDEIGLGN